jgi:hypothetical protein
MRRCPLPSCFRRFIVKRPTVQVIPNAASRQPHPAPRNQTLPLLFPPPPPLRTGAPVVDPVGGATVRIFVQPSAHTLLYIPEFLLCDLDVRWNSTQTPTDGRASFNKNQKLMRPEN